MKASILALASAFASLALASPHRHFNHHHHHADKFEKRDETQDTYVTKWVSVVKTVAVTKTIWVTPTEPGPSQVIEANSVYASSTPTDLPENPVESQPQPDPVVIPSTQSADSLQGQAKEELNVNNHQASNPMETNSTPIEDLTHSSPAPPAEELNAAPIPESAPETDSSTKELVQSTPETVPNTPETIQSTLETVPNTPETIQSTPETIQDRITNSNLTAIQDHSSNAACSSSSPCDGDITYYDPGVGYGACGWQNTKDEPVVALPHEFMGSKSNGNAYCGKTITILRDGKKSTARVVDKCMGCTGFSIDLSDAVFSQLAALSVGRTKAKWWVN